MADSTMLAFTHRAAAPPSKRAIAERARDFAEIGASWPVASAEAQAGRCSQCGVPFCQVHCPLENNIPDWLMLAAEDRLEEAYEVSAATSTMPEICGRICPQDRLCEGSCVIEQSGHGAVTIGAVEKFITDTAWEKGWVKPLVAGPPTGRSVGIIGAGPAGLTAAELLRRKGHEVDVYDRHDRAGGLLTYGIPGFKLEKPVVMRRVDRLAAGGIRFHLGVDVGRDVSFEALRDRHDALFLATGVYRARDAAIPGRDLGGVEKALDYLIASNRKGFGDAVPDFDSGRLDACGRDVVVVGGGDTAMDCVRTAVRQGAASVTCLYRRDRENMPGSAREVLNAEEEGVHFEWLAAPTAFEGADGRLNAVLAQRMRLGAPDVSGRRAPVADGDAQFRLPADLVIMALGFDAEDLPAAFAAPDLSVTRWGTIRTGPGYATSLPGVFAGGDIVRGASLVVWAMREARDAAAEIHHYLLSAKTRGQKEAA
jgi:glutamate synthase (NADPH/NADH) small chain